jgi:hypothetical protein
MAKIILNRPIVRFLADPLGSYQIRVDGRCVAALGAGRTVELLVAPGPHHLMAHHSALRRGSLDITLAPEETRRLEVGPNPSLRKLGLLSLGVGLIVVPLIFWARALQPVPRPGAGIMPKVDTGWSTLFLILGVSLTVVAGSLHVFGNVLCMNRGLVIKEVPDPDMALSEMADLLRAQPFRLTVGQMMVGVAILALALWVATSWTRYERSHYFHHRAVLHAILGRIGDTPNPSAKQTAWTAYHAAMRRKYEQAAAEGRFFVAPDPQPAWP